VATVYLSNAVRDQVAAAQEEFDAHVPLSASGLCRSCQDEGPCACQLRAERALARYGRLPRRTPGATLPEEIGRVTGGAWFTRSRAGQR
jgi:hypothetical protein